VGVAGTEAAGTVVSKRMRRRRSRKSRSCSSSSSK